ncbi:hypothetical protein Gohar_027841 [Gossypium harknessii]|uniref:Uncharacterized protein n=2 Tax=Gossypium TaxID=3633 RepID=A0A7J9ICI6_9ROSI|nr:hypothetical protein [Gossypium harknessii]
MEKEFLDKVKDSTAVQIWFEKTQQEKSDSLTEGYMLELWDFTRIGVAQNYLQELKEILDQWDDETKRLFYREYGDLRKVDLVPTVEEYTTLFYFLRIQADKAYSRVANISAFLKRLMSITEMSEQWKRVDDFALSIYGLVIFPKALGHIDEAALDLFDRLDKTKVENVSYQVFTENYSPLKEFVATSSQYNISEEKWMAILQSLQDEDVEWRAPWMILDKILYRCGDFDWFILATQGLAQSEFAYKGDNYKKNGHEISNAWNQTHKMKRFTANPMTTPEYDWWWSKKVNENKLEAEKMRKEKNKAEEDLDSLKTDYKKLRLSMRIAGLEDALERDLLESRNENVGLRAQVEELERSLHQYCSCNSVIELKASLTKIEELKGKIEELEVALQNCEL